MKNKTTGLLFLFVGIAVGYGISFVIQPAQTSSQQEEQIVQQQQKGKELIKPNKNKDVIADESGTIVVEQNNTDSIRLGENENPDSNFNEEEDDFIDDEMIDDDFVENLSDTNDIIMTEILLTQRLYHLDLPSQDSSDVSSLLDVKKEAFAQEITVEFWRSPINITGYELGRNRLKLFGFDPNESFDLRLSNDGNQLFLNTETMSIILRKTEHFQSLHLK